VTIQTKTTNDVPHKQVVGVKEKQNCAVEYMVIWLFEVMVI